MSRKCIGFILIKEYPRSKKLHSFEPYTTGEFLQYPDIWRPIYDDENYRYKETKISSVIDKLILAFETDKKTFGKMQNIRPTISPDLFDLGNTIGYVVGLAIRERKEEDFNKDEFLRGIKDGISLADGTY